MPQDIKESGLFFLCFKLQDIKESRTFLIGLGGYKYGVATVSRIDKIIGLFCRMLSLLEGSFAKETYNFIDPTDRSHP